MAGRVPALKPSARPGTVNRTREMTGLWEIGSAQQQRRDDSPEEPCGPGLGGGHPDGIPVLGGEK